MKFNRKHRLFSTCCTFFLFIGMIMSQQPASKTSPRPMDSLQHFTILPNSSLRLEGKTNVNTFSCRCQDKFGQQALAVEQAGKEKMAKFLATFLRLQVKSLDCGNPMMNRDLYKALNGDKHPFIKIELQKASDPNNSLRNAAINDWFFVRALARISLNGHSNDYWLDISGQKLSASRFRFVGKKNLKMSEFSVTPPTGLMGMIKVEDAIDIHFDLTVEVN